MYARTSPKHPKLNAKGLYPLHRILMENKLGRLLRKREVVHHIDHNKNNNNIDNLEVLFNSKHAALHAKEKSLLSKISVNCEECEKFFVLRKGDLSYRIRRSKYKKIFCSIHCGMVFHHKQIAG